VNWRGLGNDWRRDGLGAVAVALAYRSIRLVAAYREINGVVLRPGDLSVDPDPDAAQDAEARLLGPEELRRFALTEPTLSRDFVERAVARGDRCVAIVDGVTLAAYTWCSARPTEAIDGLVLHFDPAYLYIYKAHTRPDYRGRRMNGAILAAMLRMASAAGKRGLIGYVETGNARSFRSIRRLGFWRFGVVRVLGSGPAPRVHATAACRRFGYTLASAVGARPDGSAVAPSTTASPDSTGSGAAMVPPLADATPPV
jgi:GNAT superfamily N-acetyltransferase